MVFLGATGWSFAKQGLALMRGRAIRVCGALAAFIVAERAAAQPHLYTCTFQTECTRRAGCTPKEMTLTYEVAGNGVAHRTSDAEPVEVFPVDGDEGFSFVEPTADGMMRATSVLTSGAAVHSVHRHRMGQFATVTWYGLCRAGAEE